MTSLFSWNDDFLTGVPSVDAQHRRLVELINDLGELVVSAGDVDATRVAEVVRSLERYVDEHFGDEEALIRRVGLDARHARHHGQAHRAFESELGELVEGVPTLELERVRSLVEYLVRWLAYHILDVDQAMARQIRAVEGGATPGDAFERDERSVQLGTQPLLKALSGLFLAVSQRSRELKALNRELEGRVAQRTAELAAANERLLVLATQDDLTGLPNRRFAMMTLSRLWDERARYGGALSVILLDADRFKQVNDRYGHAQGDAVLRLLAERLRQAARTADTVCRMGGDEFLVVCPRSDASAAERAARRILEARAPLRTPGGEEPWDGSVSLGVAEAGAGMARVEDLLAAADQALYQAKQGGRGMVAVARAG
jgi:hemerythrin